MIRVMDERMEDFVYIYLNFVSFLFVLTFFSNGIKFHNFFTVLLCYHNLHLFLIKLSVHHPISLT